MSRLSQANALWGQLLGNGQGNAKTRRMVRQHGGALPVTAEVLDVATSGMGNAGREAYMRQLLGGPANPFVAPPGLASPDEYGYIELNGEVRQDMPGRGAVEQRKMMEALEAEQVGEQRLRALGTIAGRTGADAQAARQELGVPASPGYENLISPEQDRLIRTRAASEAAQRAQVEKYASQPNNTQANIESLWQQHDQQFPEFAGGQRPVTRAEQMQQQQASELAGYQQAVGGDVPLIRNHRGEIDVMPGWSAAQAAKNVQLKYTHDAQTESYKREIEAIDFDEPQKPEREAPPEEIKAYNQRRAHNQRRKQLTHERYFGGQQKQQAPPAPPEQGSSLPVNKAQYEAYQQQATAAGLALVVDQDDYDALDNTNGPVRFIDAADGQTYEK